MKSTCSRIYKTYTARGLLRYEIEVEHSGLHKHQVFRDDNPYTVRQKASMKMQLWDDQYRKKVEAEERRQEKLHRAEEIQNQVDLAQELTEEAQRSFDGLSKILEHTLDIDDAIDWEAMKDKSPFPVPRPKSPPEPQEPHRPVQGREPRSTDLEFSPKPSLFQKILEIFDNSRTTFRERENAQRFADAHAKWERDRTAATERYEKQVQEFSVLKQQHAQKVAASLRKWQVQKEAFEKTQVEANHVVDRRREQYMSGDPESIKSYCEQVLNNSEYPDFMPKTFDLEYHPDTKILIVDYQLPDVEALPRLKEFNFVKSRNTIDEKEYPEKTINAAYDALIYQVSIRTLHELFEADKAGALDALIFNGKVESTDKATGKDVNPCIISIQVKKDEFNAVNLARVDAKDCFKGFKGIGSSKLHSIAPVRPIMEIERNDKRFVEAYDVADSIQEGDNLAAMDWEDFEHLVRELFEMEFSVNGGEVKVTRASRDGGVDAVAFDPDPIRGGKIVIQAKRYTNTVGLSAVRDLFGTVHNEGAIKGILVTTADFGPDAIAFAKDKPLTLLSGSHLLHLLEKHGHKARIDLKEAKILLRERDEESA